MSEYRQWNLILRLFKRTKSESIDWDVLGDENDVFVTGLADYAVSLSKSSSNVYRVEIIDDDGRIVDSFSSASIDTPKAKTPAYTILREMYELARRQALGADKALDDILNALGDNESDE